MEPPANGPIVARVSGLTHIYGKKQALKQVTLDIPANIMVGLLGPDGVGKSTLMSILAGVRKIQAGKVKVLGGDIASAAHRKAVCPRIAYMPQGLGRNLYMTLSISENLDFFGRLFGQDRAERQRRIDDLTASTGLFPFKNRPAGKLSGGMKQKLGLCCALIHDPDFLILDEPTTGVDPLSRRQFWELIRRIRKDRPGMSVLVSTAYMDEASGFDWLMAMYDGQILAKGMPRELKSRVGADNLDTAFIRLLPEEKRRGHQDLIVPPREVKSEGSPLIEAQGLTRQFGDFKAVDHVSFKISRGEIFGFLGSNGCGKTTTMKMLTGLLPATEGKAFMFGERVTGQDLETRKHIGYMSQAFSLYTELTVHQNLVLHAHLFDLSKDTIEPRIQELAGRFGLESYMNDLAESLPLGTRQRLSLAVALIHQPEILILDEPTSGVDPVAREDFWELLIQLSRQDNVTIFVSTHFMNEAAWCDRISLMNAGKVLACDAPAKLIAKRGTKTLEEAFISYLVEAAASATSPATPAAKPTLSAPTGGDAPAALHRVVPEEGFSWRRLLGYAYREALEIKRDSLRLTFALAGTAILLLVLGFGVNTDVDKVTFSVFDRDQSPYSREYAANVRACSYFRQRPPAWSEEELERRLRSGELDLALEIPPDFGKKLRASQRPEISAWVDGSMPARSNSVGVYIQGLTTDFIDRYGYAPNAQKDLVVMRYWYNQDFKSIYAMVPAMIPILLLLIPAMLTSLGVVREKELGSITNFYATPVSRLEFILGKQLPYIVLAFINYLVMVAMAIDLFRVPVKGSFAALTAGASLYILSATSIGMMMSAFMDTQIAAIFGTAISTLLPATSLSGLMAPVASLEGEGAWIGKIYPTTYFMTICRGTFTKALGFRQLAASYGPLAASIPVLFGISWLLLRKQEK